MGPPLVLGWTFRDLTLFFQQLIAPQTRYARCDMEGMTISILLLAIQILALVCALVWERGEDPRFTGDKLIYRS
jgi:hypothetical protein